MKNDGILSIIDNFRKLKKINIEDVFLFPENTLFFYYILCVNGGYDNRQTTMFEKACLGDPSERFYTLCGDDDKSLSKFFKYVKSCSLIESSSIKEPNDLLMLPQIWDYYDAFSEEALKLMFDKKTAIEYLKHAKRNFSFFVLKNANYEGIHKAVGALDNLTFIAAFLLFDNMISDFIIGDNVIPHDIVYNNYFRLTDRWNNKLFDMVIYINERGFLRNMMMYYFCGKDVNSMLK